MPHGGQHPTEESMNITRKFLGGELGTPGQAPGGSASILPGSEPNRSNPFEGTPGRRRRLPAQASQVAGQRAFGQQGAQQRSLPDRFFDLPGPVGFSRTPQGQAIMQRILGRQGGFR